MSIEYLEKIHYRKYEIIRKEEEIEDIRRRLNLILDVNAAFNANKEYIGNLEKELQKRTPKSIIIKEEADKDWTTRLSRFQR